MYSVHSLLPLGGKCCLKSSLCCSSSSLRSSLRLMEESLFFRFFVSFSQTKGKLCDNDSTQQAKQKDSDISQCDMIEDFCPEEAGAVMVLRLERAALEHPNRYRT